MLFAAKTVKSKKKPEVHTLTRNCDDNGDVLKRGIKEDAHFEPDFFLTKLLEVFTQKLSCGFCFYVC